MTAARALRRVARMLYACVPGKRHLAAALRRVVHPPWRWYRHLHFTGPMRVAFEDGVGFRMVHHGHQVENDLFWAGIGGRWERRALLLWRALATHCTGSILDVGANTGVYALIARRVASPGVSVHAVEAVERIAERLETNIRLNDFDLPVHRVAISDRHGTAVLQDPGGDNPYSASLDAQRFPAVGQVTVATQRLDALVDKAGLAPPALIKIDVEGHEVAACRGLGALLDHGPTLLIEISDESALRTIESALAPHGYRWWQIHDARGLVPEAGGAFANYVLASSPEALAILESTRETP